MGQPSKNRHYFHCCCWCRWCRWWWLVGIVLLLLLLFGHHQYQVAYKFEQNHSGFGCWFWSIVWIDYYGRCCCCHFWCVSVRTDYDDGNCVLGRANNHKHTSAPTFHTARSYFGWLDKISIVLLNYI